MVVYNNHNNHNNIIIIILNPPQTEVGSRRIDPKGLKPRLAQEEQAEGPTKDARSKRADSLLVWLIRHALSH